MRDIEQAKEMCDLKETERTMTRIGKMKERERRKRRLRGGQAGAEDADRESDGVTRLSSCTARCPAPRNFKNITAYAWD